MTMKEAQNLLADKVLEILESNKEQDIDLLGLEAIEIMTSFSKDLNYLENVSKFTQMCLEPIIQYQKAKITNSSSYPFDSAFINQASKDLLQVFLFAR